MRAAGLTAALAVLLAGCGGAGPDAVADPRPRAERCLRAAGLAPVPAGPDAVGLAGRPNGPRVVFTTTVGEAASLELEGRAEDAERIGAALLVVGDGDEAVLRPIERCLAAAAPRGSGGGSR